MKRQEVKDWLLANGFTSIEKPEPWSGHSRVKPGDGDEFFSGQRKTLLLTDKMLYRVENWAQGKKWIVSSLVFANYSIKTLVVIDGNLCGYSIAHEGMKSNDNPATHPAR